MTNQPTAPEQTKVLVLGGTGLLGATIAPALTDALEQVVWLGRSGPNGVNCCDAEALARALTDYSPDVIINLVALTNVDECERCPEKAYALNTLVVENIVEWMRSSPQTHLVQVSTDQVYGDAGPHREDHVSPVNYYAFSKYAGELATIEARTTVLRTNFLGRSGHPRRQSLTDWIYQQLVSDQTVNAFTDVQCSPLSMATLAELLVRVVHHRPAGVFNAGSRDGGSKADIACWFAQALGFDVDRIARGVVADVALVARRPSDMRMDSSRLEAVLETRMPTLQQEINRMAEAYSQ